jgi:hypothetical protein
MFIQYIKRRAIMSVKYISVILLCTIIGCKPVIMNIDPHLKSTSQPMKVIGTQGWQLKKVIKFGEFETSIIKGGWQTGSSFHFLADFEKSQQKYSYIQYDGNGNSTQVFCVGKMKRTKVHVLNSKISIPIDVTDLFTTKIIIDSDSNVIDLVLYNPNEMMFEDSSEGYLTGPMMNYRILPNRELETGSFGPKIIGYEFHDDGQIVAAVQLLNGGIVWLNDSLNGRDKLVLASACTAILLRDELGENEINL